ncbi:MAG TPA: DUF177 domain-containing protein [Sphingobium sp.]|nr:DUF177 domain-containing protein [Sphingobium sp.]
MTAPAAPLSPEMPDPEFSRIVRVSEFGNGSREHRLSATPQERAALARRFGLRALGALDARLRIMPEATGCLVTGTLVADLVQPCAATGEDVPAQIDTDFTVRFMRGLDAIDEEELELSEADCDVLALEDERVDLGEVVAQTLALNLDPYPRVADANEKLRALGVLSEGEAGPFAALKALKLGQKNSG